MGILRLSGEENPGLAALNSFWFSTSIFYPRIQISEQKLLQARLHIPASRSRDCDKLVVAQVTSLKVPH